MARILQLVAKYSVANVASRSKAAHTASYITDKAYIGGQWLATPATFPVHNPFSDEIVGYAPDCTLEATEEAISSAAKAFPSWKEKPAKDRSDILKKWFDLIKAEERTLAELITLENGKSLSDAAAEVTYAANFVEWYAEEGRRTYGLQIPSPSTKKKMMTMKQPIGVVAMITPWNFPSAMTTRKAAAALAAGCATVLKPSEETPFSALALAQLGEKAGIPPGVLNIIPTSRANVSEIGRVLATHPDIGCVSFTGSTSTGKILLKQAAGTVKKVSLELGGTAPFIVFDSCDVDRAARGLMAGKFRCSGQACVSPNRVLVQSGVHDQFVTKMKELMEKELVMGDGMDPETTFGPLINDVAVSKVETQVNDAVSKGAKVTCGGSKVNVGRRMFAPTLLTDVTTSMLCFQQETFGPLAPVRKFETEDEAVSIANETTAGLAGYVYSGDVAQCWRVAEKLEAGVVGVNESLLSAVEGTFGGWKESGLGREGSVYGMDEFMEVKYMCWGV